ncbi:hypothetical protein KGQ71_03125 [Patescibacteria group bacterium]|nr:hypothetical protein [Patescibacteria group bacterium]
MSPEKSPQPENILLVDGNGLLYRAYHAFPKELCSPEGEPTGAVFGFTRILLSTIKNLKPSSVVLCFDLKGPTFRHEQYDQYKATRQKMPDDLVRQVNTMYEVVRQLEFPIYTAAGYEADDIIGTLARQITEADGQARVIILTGDQDIIQLVNDRVFVYSPSAGAKQPVLYTPDQVRNRYGFRPLQMIEYKSLRGDPSDNIPGVPGIGEVTATKLVQEYGTLEKLYEAVETDTADLKPAVLEKLRAGKESALLSHQLATIDTNAPVRFDRSDSRLSLKSPEKLIALFHKLGFRSLINELPRSHKLLSEASDIFTAGPSDSADSTGPDPQNNPDNDRTLSRSEQIDQELDPVLRKMEEVGVKLDCPYLKKLAEEFETDISRLRAQLTELADEEFNPDSPQQVSHILYEVLRVPTNFIRKGKTGYTTNAATLQELAEQYPIAQIILNYREVQKLLTTYIRPLPEQVDNRHRLHTSYAPDTTSGRISSRNPNLQNIPVRSEQGRRIRQAFIADTGKVLVSADYSQIELRVAAHLSGDPVMQAVFREGRDFHAETAERVHVDRRMAKIINFSILYGKGAFQFAKDLGITQPEAKQYIEQYFKTYATLRAFLDNILETARKNGYVESAYGKRRVLPDLITGNFQRRSAAEREAISMPIQAMAADILKQAMIRLDAALTKQSSPSQLILTVHDELVVETPRKEVEKIAALLKEAMIEADHLTVPLAVNVKVGTNWSEMEELA